MGIKLASAITAAVTLALSSSVLEAADPAPVHIEMPALPLAEALQVVADAPRSGPAARGITRPVYV